MGTETSAKAVGSRLEPWRIDIIRQELAGLLMENQPLAPRTSLRIGGPAALLLEPANEAELIKVVDTLTRAGVDWLVLGGGSNLLVADEGIAARAVISLGAGFSLVEKLGDDRQSVLLRAGAALSLQALLAFAARHEAAGLENLQGVPGTLGGALAMNAGAWGTSVSDFLAALILVDENGRHHRGAAQLRPAYRDGGLEAKEIITGAYFLLPRDNQENIRQQGCQARARRRVPAGLSAGSVFKNPASGPPAGRLLDEAGCRGLKLERARVSADHANVILVENGARARDVLQLMRIMQEKVKARFAIDLEPEIRILSDQ